MRAEVRRNKEGLAVEAIISWDVLDIYRATKGRPALSDNEISEILEELTYDADQGIDWKVIKYAVDLKLEERGYYNPDKGLE